MLVALSTIICISERSISMRLHITEASISNRVLQVLNNDHRPRASFLQVKLLRSGITSVPGKARIFKRIMNEIWNQFGSLMRFYYNPKFKFCVLEYRSHEEAEQALRSINTRQSMLTAIDNVANSYTMGDDRELAVMILHLFFPGAAFESPVAKWNVTEELFDMDVV